jgi:anti-anti-sigma factor
MRSLQELLARRVGRLILDLSGVPFADACGLGTLVECQKRIENAGSELRLRGVGPKLRELFRLTGLKIQAPTFRPRPTLTSRLRGTARGLRGPGVPRLRYLVA